jgi:hypothetical protein
MILSSGDSDLACHRISIVKTLLNSLHVHIGYDDEGFLAYTDKKSGKQKVSVKTWPDVQSAKVAVATGLAEIEWTSRHLRRNGEAFVFGFSRNQTKSRLMAPADLETSKLEYSPRISALFIKHSADRPSTVRQ